MIGGVSPVGDYLWMVHQYHLESPFRNLLPYQMEAKIAAAVMVAQDMLYVYRLLELLELNVELPMVFEMGN